MENIQETLVSTRRSPLFAWVKSNLVGWGVGLVWALLLNQFVATPIEDTLGPNRLYDYRLEPLFSGIFFWTPLGLCIGIAQWSRMKQWNIPSHGWILATTLGWGTLGIAFEFESDYFIRLSGPSRWEMLTADVLIVLLGGMLIGLFQSMAARKTFSNPRSWVFATAVGTLALYVIMSALAVVPFAVKSYILKFLYAHDLYAFVEARDLLLLGFLIIALPCVATCTLLLPTGKVLLKYIRTG